MPIFHEAAPDARERLIKRSKGFDARGIYREYLSQLEGGKMWEIAPEEGETLRKLKVNVRRAANELNLIIGYGDSEDGTLVVWLEQARERRSRRSRKTAEAGETASERL